MIRVGVFLGLVAAAGLVGLALVGFQAATGVILVIALFIALLAYGAATRG